MPKKNLVGERIKKVRLDQGLTQTEFGSRIGVKGNTVTGYEGGARVPSDSVINNICKTFMVNETWLRSGGLDSDMYIPVQSNLSSLGQLFADKNCTKLEMSILSAFYGLKEEERMAFVKLIVEMFPDAASAIAGGNPLETFWQEAPPIGAEETGDVDVDALAEKAAALVREQAASEKKTESSA